MPRRSPLLLPLLLPLLILLALPLSTQAGEPTLHIDTGMHLGDIRSLSADAAGRYLASAAEDHTVRLWDLLSGTLDRTLRLPGPISVVALSPDGHTLAAADGTTPPGSAPTRPRLRQRPRGPGRSR